MNFYHAGGILLPCLVCYRDTFLCKYGLGVQIWNKQAMILIHCIVWF